MEQSNSGTVTIVIPTYRRPQLVERAVRSVLAQTYPHVLACVYDNASGDETATVVQRLARDDNRVRYVCHESNLGSLENFNFGIHQVDTPYFTLLSDDDLLLPEFAEKAMDWLQRFPDAAFYAGAALHMSSQGELVGVWSLDWPREGLYEPAESIYGMTTASFPVQTVIVYRREVIEQFGAFDAQSPMHDYEYETLVAASRPIVVSHVPSGIVMWHEGSVSKRLGPSNHWKTFQSLTRKFRARPDISEEVCRIGVERLKTFAEQRLFLTALRSCVQGNYRDAKEGAAILRNSLGARRNAAILSTLVGACKRSRTARWLLRRGQAVSQFWRKLKVWKFRRRFAAYRSYFAN